MFFEQSRRVISLYFLRLGPKKKAQFFLVFGFHQRQQEQPRKKKHKRENSSAQRIYMCLRHQPPQQSSLLHKKEAKTGPEKDFLSESSLQMTSFVSSLFEFNIQSRTARTTDEFWDSFVRLMKRIGPREIIRSGDNVFPLPFQHSDGVSVILCNHIRDLDVLLINISVETHRDTGFPVHLSGFTYEVFRHVPILGNVVGRLLIGLSKGESEEERRSKVKYMLDRGYNTFVLFPEGALFHKGTYVKSAEYQKEKLGMKKPFKRVLHPYTKAFDSLRAVVGDRLESVTDVTLDYAGFRPRESDYSYTTYPSVLYNAFHDAPAPRIHVENIPIPYPQNLDSEKFLFRLWRRKEHRLAKWHLQAKAKAKATATAEVKRKTPSST